MLCLNTKGEEELFLDALMVDGVPSDRLPEARKPCLLIGVVMHCLDMCPDYFAEPLDALMADEVSPGHLPEARKCRFLNGVIAPLCVPIVIPNLSTRR